MDCRAVAQVAGDGADGLDCFGGRGVAREEDVEVCKVGLTKALIEVFDLGGGGAAACELAVAGVVAFMATEVAVRIDSWKER